MENGDTTTLVQMVQHCRLLTHVDGWSSIVMCRGAGDLFILIGQLTKLFPFKLLLGNGNAPFPPTNRLLSCDHTAIQLPSCSCHLFVTRHSSLSIRECPIARDGLILGLRPSAFYISSPRHVWMPIQQVSRIINHAQVIVIII